jgi:hypothetical protein
MTPLSRHSAERARRGRGAHKKLQRARRRTILTIHGRRRSPVGRVGPTPARARTFAARARLVSKKVYFDIAPLLFLFNKYYLIMD